MTEQLSGIQLMAQEREKQLQEWSAEHDDYHEFEELVWAAIAYLAPETLYKFKDAKQVKTLIDVTSKLPFTKSVRETRYSDDNSSYLVQLDKKDYSHIQRLIVAGAFIAAEIDRLIRAGAWTINEIEGSDRQ